MNTVPPASCAEFIAPQEATKSIERNNGKTLAGMSVPLLSYLRNFDKFNIELKC